MLTTYPPTTARPRFPRAFSSLKNPPSSKSKEVLLQLASQVSIRPRFAFLVVLKMHSTERNKSSENALEKSLYLGVARSHSFRCRFSARLTELGHVCDLQPSPTGIQLIESFRCRSGNSFSGIDWQERGTGNSCGEQRKGFHIYLGTWSMESGVEKSSSELRVE